MKIKNITQIRVFFIVGIFLLDYINASAEVIYVNSRSGSDANPGTLENPLKTLSHAAEMVKISSEPGPTTIKIASGVYCLNETVFFQNSRNYTRENRLIIEADILPNEPQWKPTR